ncbi:MAG: MotA/TolQ/ExbB proton channel family protein [Gammaproteobacteria bacterium]|jgi:biopolymer transport protein ExbB
MTLQTVEYVASMSGGILYVIGVLSLIALTVIVERSWALTWAARTGNALCAQLSAVPSLNAPALDALLERYGRSPYGALLEIAKTAAGKQSGNSLSVTLDEALMLQIPKVDRGLWLLDTAVTLGPLLGLLGTIIGIFSSFKALGNLSAVPTQVTGGVAEALIATAAGLVVAIIGLVCFNGLQKRVRLVVHHLETVKLMLENRLAETPIAAPQTASLSLRNGTDGGAF